MNPMTAHMHRTGLGVYFLSFAADSSDVPAYFALRRQFGARYTDDTFPENMEASDTLAWAHAHGLTVVDHTGKDE
jgi:hypothetical protein